MARDFDGAQNVIDVADDPTLSGINDEITVAMWFQYTATLLQFDGLLFKTTTSFWNDGFGVYQNTGPDELQFFVDDYTNRGEIALAPSNTALHHLTGLKDSTDIKIFLDGTQGTDQADATTFTASNQVLQIAKGQYPGYPTKYTSPIIIAYACVWNTNIPETHLQALNRGVHPFAILNENIAMLLPLYGNDDPEPDESGNGNTGAVTGAVKNVNPPVQLIEEYI